jgi:hypothetical protein
MYSHLRDTTLAFESERYSRRKRIRVRGILKGQQEATSASERNSIPRKEIYIVVLPTANVHILLEGFGREEEAQKMKELQRYFELAGLVLRENERLRWTPLFGPPNAEIKLDLQALLD